MRYFFWLFIFGISFTGYTATASGETGYRIEIEMQHFDRDTLMLGYYFGKSQYLKDTAILNKGKFVFEGPDSLAPGVYLIVIPPDNKFIHVLVTEKEQRYSLSVDLDNIVNTAKFKGSEENTIYYAYLKDLDMRRPRADELRKAIKEDTIRAAAYQKELDGIDAEVKTIQDQIIKKHPDSYTAMLIQANRDVDIPAFTEASEEDRKQLQYEYYHEHYFDNFDLADPRSMRSGLMHTKIDFYLNKLTYPYPDSQSVAMDYLLKKIMPNKEAFQYYLVHFLNEAAKSKRMGMDAVYVFLVDHYYATGLATWTDEEQLGKLKGQADLTRPTLIGKIAPDAVLYTESGNKVSIHSIDAEYTVLFFWDPECGHCKKAIPFVLDFYNNYKDKGVEVLAICTKTGDDISSCWSMAKEKGMDIWVNAADQYLRSRYKSVYDVKTTPQIFILDKNKKIIVKKIAGEDMAGVMDEVLKMKS